MARRRATPAISALHCHRRLDLLAAGAEAFFFHSFSELFFKCRDPPAQCIRLGWWLDRALGLEQHAICHSTWLLLRTVAEYVRDGEPLVGTIEGVGFHRFDASLADAQQGRDRAIERCCQAPQLAEHVSSIENKTWKSPGERQE